MNMDKEDTTFSQDIHCLSPISQNEIRTDLIKASDPIQSTNEGTNTNLKTEQATVNFT